LRGPPGEASDSGLKRRARNRAYLSESRAGESAVGWFLGRVSIIKEIFFAQGAEFAQVFRPAGYDLRGCFATLEAFEGDS
jgi:hypothetical protein